MGSRVQLVRELHILLLTRSALTKNFLQLRKTCSPYHYVNRAFETASTELTFADGLALAKTKIPGADEKWIETCIIWVYLHLNKKLNKIVTA